MTPDLRSRTLAAVLAATATLTCSPPERASARYAHIMLPSRLTNGAGFENWRPLGTYHDSFAGREPEERKTCLPPADVCPVHGPSSEVAVITDTLN